ncbi:hypothetical protein C8J57DRAFT_1250750 [Mycena rebaudengoi]|nr:hypothetical protein C8J57DRAFT_1250750 [Mycena rebaudengoi]
MVQWDLCRAHLILYDWFKETGITLARELVQLHGRSPTDLDSKFPAFAPLVKHVIKYVVDIQSARGPQRKKRCLQPGTQAPTPSDTPLASSTPQTGSANIKIPSDLYEKVQAHIVACGAVLQSIADACQGEWIFASDAIHEILLSPTTLFPQKWHEDIQFMSAVLKEEANTLSPLLKVLQDKVQKDPQIRTYTAELGNFVYWRILELHHGRCITENEYFNSHPSIHTLQVGQSAHFIGLFSPPTSSVQIYSLTGSQCPTADSSA